MNSKKKRLSLRTAFLRLKLERLEIHLVTMEINQEL